MNTRFLHTLTAIVIAGILTPALTTAEEHTRAALEHAGEAAHSTGDSATIQEHAAQALKHIDAAKAANQSNPQAMQHLRQGETNLNDAVTHAERFNSPSAEDAAQTARQHLEQASKP